MLLECGSKLEYQDKTHVGTGRTGLRVQEKLKHNIVGVEIEC